jgi:hypothetical protein
VTFAGTSKAQHFCRGCGQPLPQGSKQLFHTGCLAEDKRHRVRQQRQKQREQFTCWLLQQTCQKCGARYGEMGPSSRTAP